MLSTLNNVQIRATLCTENEKNPSLNSLIQDKLHRSPWDLLWFKQINDIEYYYSWDVAFKNLIMLVVIINVLYSKCQAINYSCKRDMANELSNLLSVLVQRRLKA
jgi:hypothetical protein